MPTLFIQASEETSFVISKYCKVYKEHRNKKIAKYEAGHLAILYGLEWIKKETEDMLMEIDQRKIERKKKLIKDLKFK
jgi:tRNA(His) 5'-end guanylyltransferase